MKNKSKKTKYNEIKEIIEISKKGFYLIKAPVDLNITGGITGEPTNSNCSANCVPGCGILVVNGATGCR